jgi:hypothetical protein
MADSDIRLAAELDIRTLVARYADAVIRRHAKDWGETWAEDAVWKIMGMETRGRAPIVALWQRLMGGFANVVQVPNACILEINGSRATGRWYITEYNKLASGAAMLTLGVYHDEYTRADGAWRFASRRFDALYGGPADLSGAFMSFPKELER